MDKEVTVQAKVVALEGVYDMIPPEIDPDGDPIYKVAFQTPEGIKIFDINSYDYYALRKGMEGELTYKGDQIIRFGNWIHPFSMQA